MKKQTLTRGDYVLATKYSDGDPCDHFFIGFYREMLGDRYLVVDGTGKLVRASGFRRCEKISCRVGRTLCAAIPLLGDRHGKSLWWWRRHIKTLEKILAVPAGRVKGE